MLFISVAIGQSNYFGFGFTALNSKPLFHNQLLPPIFDDFYFEVTSLHKPYGFLRSPTHTLIAAFADCCVLWQINK